MDKDLNDAYRKAEIKKLNAEAEKILYEIEKDRKFNKKGLTIWKYLSGGFTLGIGLVPIVLLYFNYVIQPLNTKDNLQSEIHNMEIKIAESKFDSIRSQVINIASKNEFMLEQIRDENRKLQEDKKNLLSKIDNFERRLANVECEDEVKDQIRVIKESIEDSTGVQQQGIEQNTDSSLTRLKKDIVQASINKRAESKFKGLEGWIFIGHLVDEQYGSTNTIKIEKGKPEVGEEYVLVKDCFVHDSFPKFPLYTVPDSKEILPAESKVKVQEIRDVGRSKIWARIKVS